MEWIIDRLRESEAAVAAAVGELSEAQWVWRAGDGVWTAQEVVEHLILVERGVLTLVRRAMGQPAGERGAALTDDEVWGRLTGNNRGTAPERVRPTGQWTDRGEALAEFARRRGETVVYASTTADPLRERWITLPVGQLDGAQALLMLAGHAVRHLGQIRELRGRAGFPAE